jgi:DNA polymerase III alpha subunit (gram-positive type)
MDLSMLSLIGAGVSSLAVIFAVTKVILRERAEKHLVAKLQADQDCRRFLIHQLHEGELDSEQYEALIKYLRRALQKLSDQDRIHLESVLEQASQKGRRSYMEKIATEAKEKIGMSDYAANQGGAADG